MSVPYITAEIDPAQISRMAHEGLSDVQIADRFGFLNHKVIMQFRHRHNIPNGQTIKLNKERLRFVDAFLKAGTVELAAKWMDIPPARMREKLRTAVKHGLIKPRPEFAKNNEGVMVGDDDEVKVTSSYKWLKRQNEKRQARVRELMEGI